jgi:hypothetical protein
MEASFMPFRLIRINLFEELKFKAILFVGAFSLELKMRGSELNFLVEDVHEG